MLLPYNIKSLPISLYTTNTTNNKNKMNKIKQSNKKQAKETLTDPPSVPYLLSLAVIGLIAGILIYFFIGNSRNKLMLEPLKLKNNEFDVVHVLWDSFLAEN